MFVCVLMSVVCVFLTVVFVCWVIMCDCGVSICVYGVYISMGCVYGTCAHMCKYAQRRISVFLCCSLSFKRDLILNLKFPVLAVNS